MILQDFRTHGSTKPNQTSLRLFCRIPSEANMVAPLRNNDTVTAWLSSNRVHSTRDWLEVVVSTPVGSTETLCRQRRHAEQESVPAMSQVVRVFELDRCPAMSNCIVM